MKHLAILLCACASAPPADDAPPLILASAAQLSTTVIGAWERPDQRTSYRHDGELVHTQDGAEYVGLFEVAGDRLSVFLDMSPLGYVYASGPVYVNAGQLVKPAYYPVGAHEGVIGKWHLDDETQLDARTIAREVDYVFAADGQYMLASATTIDGERSESEEQGTYESLGDNRFVLSGGQEVELIDDTVLADAGGAFRKVTP